MKNCPRCGSEDIYRKRHTKPTLFRCRKCRGFFDKKKGHSPYRPRIDYGKNGPRKYDAPYIHGNPSGIDWRDTREYALRLYDYKCADCGDSKKRLNLHHVDGDPTNNCWDNLVMVCTGCHNKRHSILKGQKYTQRQMREMEKQYSATFNDSF